MKIVQFECDDVEVAGALKQILLEQVNTWSRLQHLASDPDYGTSPFGDEQWHVHTTNPDLYWADWDAIYANLGDDGRVIADQMLGDGPLQGVLKYATLVTTMPDVKLEVIESLDLVADGYLPAPEPEEE